MKNNKFTDGKIGDKVGEMKKQAKGNETPQRTGIGLCQQPFDSPLGVKKRLNYSVVLVLPTGIEPITNP